MLHWIPSSISSFFFVDTWVNVIKWQQGQSTQRRLQEIYKKCVLYNVSVLLLRLLLQMGRRWPFWVPLFAVDFVGRMSKDPTGVLSSSGSSSSDSLWPLVLGIVWAAVSLSSSWIRSNSVNSCFISDQNGCYMRSDKRYVNNKPKARM